MYKAGGAPRRAGVGRLPGGGGIYTDTWGLTQERGLGRKSPISLCYGEGGQVRKAKQSDKVFWATVQHLGQILAWAFGRVLR